MLNLFLLYTRLSQVKQSIAGCEQMKLVKGQSVSPLFRSLAIPRKVIKVTCIFQKGYLYKLFLVYFFSILLKY